MILRYDGVPAPAQDRPSVKRKIMSPQLTPLLAAGFLVLVVIVLAVTALSRYFKVGPNQVRQQPVNNMFSKY